METINVSKTIPTSQAGGIRTNTSDIGAKEGQDRGTSVGHLTLDGELSLDGNTGHKENGRENNDGDEFRDHVNTQSDDTFKIIWNRTIDCNRN